MSGARKAIVIGVGPEAGLGGALCRRFASEGLHVFVAGRTLEKVEAVARGITRDGGRATAVQTDTTSEDDVIRLFDLAEKEGAGDLDLVVYNAGNARMGDFQQMEAAFFEDTWRVGCFGGFLVGREAARRFSTRERGTILFTGATASVKARPPFTAFASAKAGLRALAQAMAREFGPGGIHVAHVIIDGGIAGEKIQVGAPAFAQAMGDEGLVSLEGLAGAYSYLYAQPRTAWTHELDLRTFKETF